MTDMRRLMSIMEGAYASKQALPETAYVPTDRTGQPTGEFRRDGNRLIRAPRSRFAVVEDPSLHALVIQRDGKPMTHREWGLTVSQNPRNRNDASAYHLPKFGMVNKADGVLYFDEREDAEAAVQQYEDALRRRGYTD